MHFVAVLLAVALQITAPVWTDAPPSMPKGVKIAVLEGDPKVSGMFTVRLHVPQGTTIASHTHPSPERVTVLSGKVRVDINDKETTFASGGFYINPPAEPHSLTFEEETFLQITGEGPWRIEYVE